MPVPAFVSAMPELQLIPLLRRLTQESIDFIVIGGVAVEIHGYARFTKDLDIVYATNSANLERLATVLVELGARLRGFEDLPFVPDMHTLRRTQMLTLVTPLGSLDLLVDPEGSARYEDMRARALTVDVNGTEIRVIALEDLLSMKRAARRPQDLADVDALLTAQRVRRRSEQAPE